MMRFLSRAAAAKILNLTPTRVYQIAREGGLPVGAEVDQACRTELVFRAADVEALRCKREARKAA